MSNIVLKRKNPIEVSIIKEEVSVPVQLNGQIQDEIAFEPPMKYLDMKR